MHSLGCQHSSKHAALLGQVITATIAIIFLFPNSAVMARLETMCPSTRMRFAANFPHFVRTSARSILRLACGILRPQRRPLENYASGQGNNEWPAAAGILALPLLAVAHGRESGECCGRSGSGGAVPLQRT